MVRFLERYGYPVAYTTIDSIDRDPGQVPARAALIDVGHSEYWSAARRAGVRPARATRGTSLLFISSDTMAWRVRFAPAGAASSQAGEPDHTDRRLQGARGSATPTAPQPTGLFPLGGADLVGSAYDGCITPRVAQPGPPVYRYYAWAPSPGLQPRWLFAGTGDHRLDADSRGSSATSSTSARRPRPRARCSWAAATARVHAPRPSRRRCAGTVAETTLYTARSGALVFATGTLGWLYALSPVPQASPDAPAGARPARGGDDAQPARARARGRG